MKTCTRCHEVKAVDQYYVDRRRGPMSQCKACHRLYKQKRSPQKRAEYRRRYGETPTSKAYRPIDKILADAEMKRAAEAICRFIRRVMKQPSRQMSYSEWKQQASPEEYQAHLAHARVKYRERYRRQTHAERARARKYKMANPHRVKQWQTRRAHIVEQQSDGTLTR